MTETGKPWLYFFFWVDQCEMICTHAPLSSKGPLFEKDEPGLYS